MTQSFDLVVIGAGIHGAGIAQAAAARGLSVLVLEQAGVASGTSSRSSKLIHGGLRYLESRQFSLVRECLQERALLLKLAAGLVELKPFYIPIYRDTARRPWLLYAGLSLYRMLGDGSAAMRFRRVPRRDWKSLDGLDTTGLEAVFQYYDAQTDDTALTNAVMRSAQSLGAQLKTSTTFTGALLGDPSNIIEYSHDGKCETCRGAVLVNAAGPWVQEVLSRIAPAPPQLGIELVQGTHILLPGKLAQGIYYVEAADRRVVFVMPWKGNTLVGTTEFDIPRQSRGCRAASARGHLPDRNPLPLFPAIPNGSAPSQRDRRPPGASGGNATEGWAGSLHARSRETVLQVDRSEQSGRSRLLTVYGGKLTTYRLTAERVMARLADALPVRAPLADTRYLELT